MNELQRDFGRVETKVEHLVEDVKAIKADLTEIKDILNAKKAIQENDWKRLTAVGILAAVSTHIFNWLRPFINFT